MSFYSKAIHSLATGLRSLPDSVHSSDASSYISSRFKRRKKHPKSETETTPRSATQEIDDGPNDRHSHHPATPEVTSKLVGPVPHGSVSSQVQSKLFLLPAEIRNSIYEFALGGDVIHVFRVWRFSGGHCIGHGCPSTVHKHFNHVRCPEGNIANTCFDCTPELGCLSCDCRCLHSKKFYGDNSLTLVLTCRRMYTEAIDILYSTNVFSFGGAVDFCDFVLTVPPESLRSIKSLQIKFYGSTSRNEQTVRLLSQYFSRLRLHLILPHDEQWADWDWRGSVSGMRRMVVSRAYLGPLATIKGLKEAKIIASRIRLYGDDRDWAILSLQEVIRRGEGVEDANGASKYDWLHLT